MATISRAIPAAFNTTPANTDLVSSGDDEIRNTRIDFRERITNGGHVFGEAVNYSYDGRHACGASGDGTDQFIIYAADKNTAAFIVDDSEKKIKANTSGGWVIEATTTPTSNVTRRAFSWWMPATLTTGRETFPVVQIPQAATLISVRVHVYNATPLNTSIRVQLLKCAAANNPTSGNFANVLTTYAEIATGQYKGSTTNFTSTALADGDFLVPNVTQIGSAGNEGGDLTVTVVLDM